MALMEWDSRRSVGHPKIDEQHQSLADTINELGKAVDGGKNSGELEALMAALRTSAETHFLAEDRIYQTLQQMASSDLLTAAWNRRHFEQVVEAEIHRSRRYGHPVSLLLLDIDHFKRVNDTFGHCVGDDVLREVADGVRSTIRLADSLTRWGGEEFIVLLPNTGLTSAIALAERVRRGLAARVFATAGHVTASFGVAEFAPSESREAWVDRADRAMYRAKDRGRNRVEADHLPGEELASTDHVAGAFLRLSWSPVYRCGSTVIDAQHEHLFQLSNEVLDALLSGRPADEVSDSVEDLLSSIGNHFRDEEQILAELRFPGLDRHATLHAKLLNRALELEQAFRGGTLSLGELVEFLAHDVVAAHMLRADREFFYLTAEAPPAEDH
jgi:diguanylate cyclase (GGDEF)-like protein/hemerythrin-like metal-binding protein